MNGSEKRLTVAEVCAIVKACAKLGVVDLKFGELEVSFQKKREGAPRAVKERVRQQEAVSLAALERDELAQKEDELEQMKIEDPVAYEKAILSGDLISPRVGEGLDGEGYSGAE